MPYVDPYPHSPTDRELDDWDERFEYTDAGVIAAKMLRTLIRELKIERARNNGVTPPLGMPAPAIRARDTAGGNALPQQDNRFRFRLRGYGHTNHPQGGFAQLGRIEEAINARDGLDRAVQYAQQDAEFTTQMMQAFRGPEDIVVGMRVMSYPGTGYYRRTDLPEMHGTVVKTKRKGAVPSIKVAWDHGVEGYISGRYVKPSDRPAIDMDTLAEGYEID